MGLRGWILEVQDQAGERVLSLGHNSVAASLTAFLWTEDLRVPEIPGETGLVRGGLSKRREVVSLSPNENGHRRIHVGKGGAKGGPCSATGFLPGGCPVSLLLEAISPEKEYNDRLGYFPGF